MGKFSQNTSPNVDKTSRTDFTASRNLFIHMNVHIDIDGHILLAFQMCNNLLELRDTKCANLKKKKKNEIASRTDTRADKILSAAIKRERFFFFSKNKSYCM